MKNEKINIVILTQDDPFYLPQTITYFLEVISDIYSEIYNVKCIVILPQSVSGRRQNFFQKVNNTIRVFGLKFFFKYSISFVIKKLIKRRSIETVAKAFNIPSLKVTGSINDTNNLRKLSEFNPDVLVSIGASQIFKSEVISMAPLGCLNLHTGMLPKYRGLMPTFWAMLNEEKFVGISVFLVDEGIDSGPIVVQKQVEIGDKSQSKLIEYTKKIGMDAIIEALEIMQKNNTVFLPNEAENATYFGFPNRLDVLQFISKGKRF